jgi:hypothetical protein
MDSESDGAAEIAGEIGREVDYRLVERTAPRAPRS